MYYKINIREENSLWIGVVNRFLVLCKLLYYISYVYVYFDYEKGIQPENVWCKQPHQIV